MKIAHLLLRIFFNPKFGLISLFIFLIGGASLSLAEDVVPPRAMWVWNWRIATDPQATKELLDFCNAQNINLLFFYADVNFKSKKTRNNFEIFLEKAHQKGIFVHALAGDPRWALSNYQRYALSWVRRILVFNKNRPLMKRFDGVHLDIEPYTLGKTWEDNKKDLLQQLLSLNKKIKDLISNSGQFEKFGIDIPFWFDQENLQVNWQDKEIPIALALIDIADYVVIMDYRNFASGASGSILLAKDEIEYAAKVNKRIYIGQETQKDLEPPYITFGDKSIDYMEGELNKLITAYKQKQSFLGIAIHYYASYKELLKNENK